MNYNLEADGENIKPKVAPLDVNILTIFFLFAKTF